MDGFVYGALVGLGSPSWRDVFVLHPRRWQSAAPQTRWVPSSTFPDPRRRRRALQPRPLTGITGIGFGVLSDATQGGEDERACSVWRADRRRRGAANWNSPWSSLSWTRRRRQAEHAAVDRYGALKGLPFLILLILARPLFATRSGRERTSGHRRPASPIGWSSPSWRSASLRSPDRTRSARSAAGTWRAADGWRSSPASCRPLQIEYAMIRSRVDSTIDRRSMPSGSDPRDPRATRGGAVSCPSPAPRVVALAPVRRARRSCCGGARASAWAPPPRAPRRNGSVGRPRSVASAHLQPAEASRGWSWSLAPGLALVRAVNGWRGLGWTVAA